MLFPGRLSSELRYQPVLFSKPLPSLRQECSQAFAKSGTEAAAWRADFQSKLNNSKQELQGQLMVSSTLQRGKLLPSAR